MNRCVLPLILAGAFLFSSCSPSTRKDDPWDQSKLTIEPQGEKDPEFGKGLEGRTVAGKKVYTIQVDCMISPEGRVTGAHVHRADAPERLQWGVVRGVKRMRT